MAGGQPVVLAEVPHWYGLPQYGVDAIADLGDGYTTVITAARRCTSMSLYVETFDAIISFDGGTTEHFFLDASMGQILLTGLDIPKGAVIQAKNASAGSDYLEMSLAIW